MRVLPSAALVLALALGSCAATLAAHARAPPRAAPPGAASVAAGGGRGGPAHTLHGRFLHVTDMHPDQFYTSNATVTSSCHLVGDARDDPEAELRAGYWGTPRTECDAPVRLVQRALAWAAEAFGSPGTDAHAGAGVDADAGANASSRPSGRGLDFILWTGDNVRHDTGPVHPRTREEIFAFNRWCIEALQRAFPGVPIVPAIGNNDVYPHNIMWPGPNDVTFAYARMWTQFGLLPESEAHVCSIGGYFARDVVPAALTVFSLNTMYWFKSNKMVDGCNSRRGDPGGLQLVSISWIPACPPPDLLACLAWHY